jgi:phospholipid/cholesterol/gamma-HCH transport system substrate-binding protein
MRLKNEVTVGIVVIAAIILLVFGTFWLSGRPFGEEQTVLTAIFDEAGELREGSPVKFRGVQVGRVTDIELAQGGEGVVVSMEVRPGLDLPPEPAVVLSPASLFGDWQAAIISMPDQPDLEFTRSRSGDLLPGAALPDITQLTAVGARIAEDLEILANRVELAFTEETAIKIRETVDNVQEASEQFTGFVEQQTAAYEAVSQNVLSATQNIEDATATVQRVAVGVEAEVPLIVANARDASTALRELSESLQAATLGVPSLVARADTTLAGFDEMLTDVRGLMAQLEPAAAEVAPMVAQAREAMASLQRVMDRVEGGEGTLGRLAQDPALYEELQAAISTLRRVMADLQANPARYIGEIRIF